VGPVGLIQGEKKDSRSLKLRQSPEGLSGEKRKGGKGRRKEGQKKGNPTGQRSAGHRPGTCTKTYVLESRESQVKKRKIAFETAALGRPKSCQKGGRMVLLKDPFV